MDPLTAFGLAANILQYIDFGYKLVKSAAEIHGSATGTKADNSDMIVTVGRLEEVSGKLKTPASPDPKYQALCILSQHCQNLSKELLNLSKSFTAKPGSIRGSMKASINMWRKKDVVESIRSRLNEYRGQMLLEITVLLK
jgi:hypothetical protein